PSTAGDVQLGLCAALAAGAKQEGLVMAAALVAVQLGRRVLRRAWPDARGLTALLGPPALVVSYTWWRIAQHHLLQSYDKGLPSWDRLVVTLGVIAHELVAQAWHGLALLLLALPLLLLVPRLRPFAAVAGLHLAAYLASCAGQDTNTQLLVVTTFSRIVLQVFPATVAAMALAVFRAGTRARRRLSRARSGCAVRRRGRGGAAHLDHLGDDGDGDLAGSVAADGQADGRAQPGAVERQALL